MKIVSYGLTAALLLAGTVMGAPTVDEDKETVWVMKYSGGGG